MLDACLDTARGCAEHCRLLTVLDLTTLGEQAVAEIAAHARQIESYRRSVQQIIEQSQGTPYRQTGVYNPKNIIILIYPDPCALSEE